MPSRILAFYLHGTTFPSPGFLERPIKYASGFFCSYLFTVSTDFKLLAMKDAPQAAHNFQPIHEDYINKEDYFYYQWPGNTGELAWKMAAKFLISQINQMVGDVNDDDTVNIVMYCHSHGGNVARKVAEHYEKQGNVTIRFHFITIETPLSIAPAIIMPPNVATWQQFYNPNDINQAAGSLLWQKNCSCNNFSRRIEEVLEVYNEQNNTHIKKPDGWGSTLLPGLGLLSGHNDAVRKTAADFIRQTVQEILIRNLSQNTSELTASSITI